jgi:low temperature requirement protein LtrA
MNAGIVHAFDDGPWLFAGPMLVAVVGLCVRRGHGADGTAPRALRTPPRVGRGVGAALGGRGTSRPGGAALALGAAAAIDFAGSFTAHPLPGRVLHSERLAFDAEHMLERMRLFLIILLGVSVHSIGRVISGGHAGQLTLPAALGGFVALVSLWFTYFGAAERVVVCHAATSEDPIRTIHLGNNVLYGVVVGLVGFAAGAELVIAHPDAALAGLGGVLPLGGPALYVAAQGVYFRMTTRRDWLPRVDGAVLLGLAAAGAYWLPAMVTLLLLVVVLLGLAVYLSRARETAEAGGVPLS